MIRLAGMHGQSVQYYYEGYVYNRDVRNTIPSNIFRCNTRSRLRYPGRLYTDNLLNVPEKIDHVQHPVEEDYVERRQFRQEIYRLCETTFLPFAQIFEQVSLRYFLFIFFSWFLYIVGGRRKVVFRLCVKIGAI